VLSTGRYTWVLDLESCCCAKMRIEA
jgi:hypothetical protein